MRVEVSNNNNNIKANKKQKLHNMQRQIKGKGKSNSKLKTELKSKQTILQNFHRKCGKKVKYKNVWNSFLLSSATAHAMFYVFLADERAISVY